MSDQLSMFSLWTSPDIPSAISSQASADGHMPCGLLDGQMTGQCGQDHARASHSVPQERAAASETTAIYGPHSAGSSASAALQRSLESKLQARLGLNGSTLYRLTWKIRATPSRRLISALRASALHTSGSAYGGLPTPSGTSNHGKNHVAGRLDEWGGSSNPFRGTSLGRVHCPGFELWVMGYPETWLEQMPPETPSSRKLRRNL